MNNEEQVNVKKEKDAEAEALEFAKIILNNIKDNPLRSQQIQIMIQTDPFCNYKRIVEFLTEELNKNG